MEWLSWSNGAYLAIILLGGYMAVVSAKYRNVLKEIKEALEEYRKAAADGEITEEERDLVAKLNEKYGPGQLDPQTGVFTPTEEPAVSEN